jgi:phage terminase small subunit|tara:strand:- start:17157 stop:17501 length:345 start_codon:yes stop_codon:yes gene_type:complete
MDRKELIARLKENPNYKAELEKEVRYFKGGEEYYRKDPALHYFAGLAVQEWRRLEGLLSQIEHLKSVIEQEIAKAKAFEEYHKMYGFCLDVADMAREEWQRLERLLEETGLATD